MNTPDNYTLHKYLVGQRNGKPFARIWIKKNQEKPFETTRQIDEAVYRNARTEVTKLALCLSSAKEQGEEAVNILNHEFKECVTFETFKEIWDEQNAADRLGPSTLVSYNSIYKNHIVKFFGTKAISKISKSDVNQAVIEFTKSSSGATKLNVLRRALEIARDNGLCGRFPIKHRKAKTQEVGWLTGEQVERSLEIAKELEKKPKPTGGKNRKYYLTCLLLAETGMRGGECAGLMWKHINLEAKTISIEQQADRDGTIRETKTNTSRVSHMTERLSTYLKREKLKRNPGLEDRLIQGSSCWISDTASNVIKALRAEDPSVMSTVKNGSHVYRHSIATNLVQSYVAKGRPKLIEIQEQLGHGSINVTEGYYHRIKSEGSKACIDAIEEERAEKGAPVVNIFGKAGGAS